MSGNFVIAGGSKGIGLELVRKLSHQADDILVLSRHADELETGGNVRHVTIDFTESEMPSIDLPESIDGVAYCPGTINLRSFRSLKLEYFQSDLDTNLMGAIKLLQACLPGLKKGSGETPSSVVTFSTVAVGKGMSMHASIAAAKGAIEGLTRSLAAEWAPNIRVNCVAPALTETSLAARFFRSEESKKAMADKYPMERTGMPCDIAETAAFLLSPASSWITGQVLSVDGGMSTLSKS